MKKHKTMILLIVIVSIVTMLPFFSHEPLLGHDELFHLSNIEVLSKYLSWNTWKQGFHIIPEIANDLGYGIGIFYPILPHLLGATIYKILSLFHLPVIGSIYILYFLVTTLSSIIVYFISLEVQENKKIAFLSAIFYMTAPYLLNDLWIRFSFNEIFLFLFFPMTVLGLFKLLKGEKKTFYIFFILGYIGMITSHLVMSLYFTILLFPFFFIYSKKMTKRECLRPILVSIGVVSIFVLPNIVLFLEHWLTGNYIVFQNHVMTSLSLVESEALHIQDYLIQTANYDWTCAYHIPIILTFLFLISIFMIIRNKKQGLGYFIFLFFISLFMTSSIFPWRLLPDILLMIQFPWRLEIALLLSLCIIGPFCLERVSWFNKKGICIIFVIIYLVSQVPFMTKLLNRPYELKYYSYTANDAMGHQQEYLPVESEHNWKYKHKRVEVINGSAHTEIVENNEKFVFYVNDIDKQVTIEIPKLYYLGYQLQDEYGNDYTYKKSQDGYIKAVIDQNSTYTLTYRGTNLYRFFRMMRFLFLIFICGYGIYRMNRSKI